MILGMLGMVSFNLVDAFYVGRLGTDALAALSFTFPVVLVIGSMALGLGMGAAAVISRAIGEGDVHRVRRLTSDSLILALIIVAILICLGLLSLDSVFRLLGAEGTVLELVKKYMRIWYPGMIFVVVPMVGNNAIRATGDTKTPSFIMIVAVVMNFIFDPLLIFGIGPFPRLELQGAAVSTVCSRTVTMAVALYVLGRRERMLTKRRPGLREIWNSWRRILYIGLPTAGTRMVIPLATGVITGLLSGYGPAVVAAYGVSTRIEFFSLTVIRALSSVIAPFVGQNWGAGRHDRVGTGIRLGSRFALAWGVLIYALLVLLARPIASIFNRNPEVIRTLVLYLRIVPIGYALQGVLLLSTAAMNALNRPLHSAVIVLLQMLVLYVPLAFLGSFLFGVTGVFAALALAYCAAGGIAYGVFRRVLGSLERLQPAR
jgi:putative MATE family efflux protein